MGRFRNKVIVALAFMPLGGCAAAPLKVMSLDKDTYRLSVAGAPYETQAAVNSKAVIAAHVYCSGSGRKLLFRQSTESGLRPWSRKREELTFVCVEPSDFASGVIVARQ